MEPEEVIFMKGFTLQDAMSVLEVRESFVSALSRRSSSSSKIGEPRLDSGITPQEERRPPFNPLFQFLPEEICWILDRSFACEVNEQNACLSLCRSLSDSYRGDRWNGMPGIHYRRPYSRCSTCISSRKSTRTSSHSA